MEALVSAARASFSATLRSASQNSLGTSAPRPGMCKMSRWCMKSPKRMASYLGAPQQGRGAVQKTGLGYDSSLRTTAHVLVSRPLSLSGD